MFIIRKKWKCRMILPHYCGENNCHMVIVLKFFMLTTYGLSKLKKMCWGPVLGDGFVKVVIDSGLQKNDYLLFNTLGSSTWYLDVFKSCVLDNSFITSIRDDDDFIVSTIYEIITFLYVIFFFAYFV
ncbi:hypothetical protein HanPSC8_Chr05g0198991 [Helianthus annuus]|nr:hypothetical protein HanPSC8_Chr05g0198991 [Helianthus annuus]